MKILIVKALDKSGYLSGSIHEIDQGALDAIRANNEIKILEEDVKPDKPKRITRKKTNSK